MPRLVQSVPKYRKHRGSGQAVVTVNGQDHYLGPHGTKVSKIEYDRLIGEWLASGRSTSFGAPQHEVTVVEMVADYLRYAKGYYGDDPRGTYPAMANAVRHLTALYGRTAAVDFGVLQFKALRQSVATSERSRAYVNEIMRRIVSVFRWAAAEGKIPANVPQNLGIIPGLRKGKCELREPKPIQPVADDIVDATLPHMPDVPADMVRFQRLTGCRPAEVCALRPCDLDRSGEVWLYRPGQHKTAHHGHTRTILVGPRAQGVLLRYLARDAETFCFRPCDSESKRLAELHAERRTPLSCGNRPGSNRRKKPRKTPGEAYTTMSYCRAITRGCDKAFPHPELDGIRHAMLTAAQRAELKAWQTEHRWAPNQLRHAAATEVRREFGLEAAQVMLGHSRADVTQVYAERDLAKGLAVAKAIG